MHTVLYLSLFIIHSLICWPSDIPVGKHPNDNNNESNHQRSDIVEKCHIAEIDNSVFSDTCKLYHFSAIPLHSRVVKMQTLHGHNKQSGRSGFDHFEL